MPARYLALSKNFKLKKLADDAFAMLESCQICPRKCKVNRINGQTGFCRSALKPKIYRVMPHFGEEPPISARKGSGAIFFSGCNMHCQYCQNHMFSQGKEGKEVNPEELASLMLELQKKGCHNINLVTPTHFLPQILRSCRDSCSTWIKDTPCLQYFRVRVN